MADFRWGKFHIAIGLTLLLEVKARWCKKIQVGESRKNDRFKICRENVDFRYGWGYFRLWSWWDSSWLSQICRACWAITLAPVKIEEFIFAGRQCPCILWCIILSGPAPPVLKLRQECKGVDCTASWHKKAKYSDFICRYQSRLNISAYPPQAK